MINIQPRNIFSRRSLDANSNSENRKIRYWLQKLYIQREKANQAQTEVDPIEIESNRADLHDHHHTEKDRELTQLGIDESTKQIAIKVEKDRKIVDELVKKSNRCIISISSTFPWELFPDTIQVEESKVTFKFNQFLSSQTHSVEIKDIANVLIETSLFFATIKIVSRIFVENEITIEYLDKKKALQVQSIIEGLRMFAENKVDTSVYEIDELITKIGHFHSQNTKL